MSIFRKGLAAAKKYAKKNPDKTRSAVDRGEDAVGRRTGHRYDDKVDKVGDKVAEHLTGEPNPDKNV